MPEDCRMKQPVVARMSSYPVPGRNPMNEVPVDLAGVGGIHEVVGGIEITRIPFDMFNRCTMGPPVVHLAGIDGVDPACCFSRGCIDPVSAFRYIQELIITGMYWSLLYRWMMFPASGSGWSDPSGYSDH